MLKNQKGKKKEEKTKTNGKKNWKEKTKQEREKKMPRPHLRTHCRRGPLRACHVPRRAGGRVRGQLIHIARNRLDGGLQHVLRYMGFIKRSVHCKRSPLIILIQILIYCYDIIMYLING